MTEGDAPPLPLEARLWGSPRFSHRGVAVVPPSHKAVALLAYLVVAGKPVGRDELALMLWGSGRLANVRQALYTLRSLPGAEEWLDDGAQRVGVAATSDVRALAQAPEVELAGLADGLDGAEFLAGLDERLPSEYLDWLAHVRGRYAALARRAFIGRAAQLEGLGELRSARDFVRRATALDPYDDELQRTAMRLAYLAGESDAALAGYHEFAARLAEELGGEPAAETKELVARIERREAIAPRTALAALTEDERRIVQALAVARGGLRVDGLAAVLERQAFGLAADLARLGERGVVGEQLELAPEQRRAALASLPPPLTRLLHERIAAEMRSDNNADQGALARHLLAAGEPGEAARRALAAATAALERTQLERATDLLYLALWSAQDEPSLRLEACLALEGVAARRADYALQETLLAEVEQLAWEAQSDQALAEGGVRRARFMLTRGKVGEALEAALKALEIALRVGDPALAARARNAVGAAHFYTGDLDGAAEAFAANLAGDGEERYRAHNNLGSINAMRGRLNEAYQHFAAALTLARRDANRMDVSATLNNLGATAERLGDYGQAIQHFREGIGLARRTSATRREAEMLVNLAVVYARQGQLGPAWNTTLEVEALGAELGDLRLALRAAEQRGEIERLCGDLERAMEDLAAAERLAEQIGDERKRKALEAQRLVIRARLDPAAVGEAERLLEALESSGLKDVAPWLRLELASWAPDAGVARTQLARLGPDDLQSAHQHLVRDVALMRSGLLALQGLATTAPEARGDEAMPRPGAGSTLAVEDARRARARLVAAGLLPGEADVLPAPQIVERPKARYLARYFARLLAAPATLAEGGDAVAGAAPAVPADVLDELREQGAGLPRGLVEALLRTPSTWLPNPDDRALTPRALTPR